MFSLIKKAAETIIDTETSASLLKDTVLWGIQIFEKKRNETINEFYRNLFNGEVTPERIEYEKEHIKANEEQYYILLNLAISDEEKEKNYIYANTYRFIRDNSTIDKKMKTKLIKLAKNLPSSAIELLPEIHVHKHFNTQYSRRDSYLNDILNKPEFLYEANILIQNGIFKQIPVIGNTIKVEETDLFELIMKVFFNENDLTPYALGLKVWAQKVGILSDLTLENSNNRRLIQILLRNSIKNGFEVDINQKLSPINIANFNKLIVILNQNKLSKETVEQLYQTSKYIPIIKVTFDNKSTDQLPKINGDLFYIKNDNELDFINFFNSIDSK